MKTSSYFTRMLTAVFEFMLLTGLSRKATTQIVHSALDGASKSKVEATSFSRPSDLVAACMVLDRWRKTPGYVDQLAQPRPVKMYGPAPSVQALLLAERHATRSSLKPEHLKAIGLVTHVGAGRYKPSKPHGVVSDLNPAFQHQVAHSLFMLLRTIRSNMAVSNKKDRWIERFAEIPDLPLVHADAFREFAKRQGHVLLQTVNDWLEARRLPVKAVGKRKTTAAGIHVYAYLGDAFDSPTEGMAHRRRPRRRKAQT
jgi:hypothetical protein